MIWAAIALMPAGVMAECRERAEREPLRLSRNWVTAVLIALLWLGCVEGLIW